MQNRILISFLFILGLLIVPCIHIEAQSTEPHEIWYQNKNHFEWLCKEKGLPIELATLPIALDAVSKKTVNTDENTGIWQLNYIISKRYGLRIESFYDERLDANLSAQAALSYLEDLYEITGDWYLAITAYSCGMPQLRKSISACGNTNPDSLKNYLPKPAAEIYSMFLISPKIADSINSIALSWPQLMPQISASVYITKLLHIEQISAVMQIEIQSILDYNPLFTDVVIDGRKEPLPLRLPPEKAAKFSELQDSIASYMDSIYFPKPQKKHNESGAVRYTPIAGHERIDYIIQSGDNLGSIAEKFEVKQSEIKDWNGIIGNNIYAGKKLYIYKPKAEIDKFRNISHKEISKPKKSAIPKNSKKEIYKVKSGDSPYTIAKKYEGISETDIMQWNGISDPSKIQVGQELIIYIKK